MHLLARGRECRPDFSATNAFFGIPDCSQNGLYISGARTKLLSTISIPQLESLPPNRGHKRQSVCRFRDRLRPFLPSEHRKESCGQSIPASTASGRILEGQLFYRLTVLSTSRPSYGTAPRRPRAAIKLERRKVNNPTVANDRVYIGRLRFMDCCLTKRCTNGEANFAPALDLLEE